MTVVLVIAAHTDDEALGCAGTIAKHVASGDEVHLLFMTDGVGSRLVTDESVLQRKNAADKAAKILGVSSKQNFDFPDNQMDSVPLLDIVKRIEGVIDEHQPEIIYTHHIGDLNVDHQVTHKAALTACRPQPSFCVREICAFEVMSSTEWSSTGSAPFLPNMYVDIADYWDVKSRVLQAYSDEMRQIPHSRSI
ncbi:MAG: PIG-L family deacetylase, partial [Candidatus Zixiibacteriota bacterium]